MYEINKLAPTVSVKMANMGFCAPFSLSCFTVDAVG